ncbi:MAG: hypothetical protein ACTJHT_16270 [Sphingobacterium sp.]
MENTNLSYTIDHVPDKSNLRETFLLGQLLNTEFDVQEPAKGDFLVEGVTIEVGGKNKTAKQVREEMSYLILDQCVKISGCIIFLLICKFI